MDYTYTFDVAKCLYKEVCNKYGTEDCRAACIRYSKMDYLIHHSLLTSKQRQPIKLIPSTCDAESFNELKQIKDNINSYVSEGRCLFLGSPNTGNGKTSWACKLLMAYLNSIWHTTEYTTRALFIHVPSLMYRMKENISGEEDQILRHIKDNILTANLVIFDDVASKQMTTYENEILLSFIDSRINAGLSNICTSNMIQDTLKLCVGDRLYSRIYTGSKIVIFRGMDRRGIQ